MMLGVFAHAAIEYTQWGPSADVSGRSVFADTFLVFSYAFRMEAFLLLSGFFARLLYMRRGPRIFLTNRIKRIVVPLLVMLLPVNIARAALQTRTGGGLVGDPIWPLRPGHLWFLYYLMLFLVAALIVVRLPKLNLRFLDSIVSYAAPLALAVPTAMILVGTGGDTTPVSFIPEPRLLLHYGFFFMIGWLVQSREGLIGGLAQGLPIRFGLAVVAYVAMAGFFAAALRLGEPARYAAFYARSLFAWYMTFAFTGFFLRFFARPGKVVSYLADASYWTYLIMLPILIVFQTLLRRTDGPIGLEYLVSVTLTFLVCLVSYQLFVRWTVVGRLLNGRRVARV
jgi:peptidoglycan/LPS O-acetylase OafA/YrhL